MTDRSPRVLHVNDCAGVAANLVRAARTQGYAWRHLRPEQVRPAGPTPTGVGRARWLPFVARRGVELTRSEVVHVHYATSVPLITSFAMPRRPYLLHLHGTDIRQLWTAPATRELVRRAVDGATHVYYTNLDTAENARSARDDAEFMPALVDPAHLPSWRPGSGAGPTVVFASRWGAEKGAATMLQVAAALRSAVPGARLVGLDWGPRAAEARTAGVDLVAPLPHDRYLDLLAGADVVVGQATGLLGVSELEAMGIGVPVAMPGSPWVYPDGTAPPVIAGSPSELADQVRAALEDPVRTAEELGGRAWVREGFVADRYVSTLERRYEEVARTAR
jgi:glycosyltransferase involved in cell wall biosynthesis